MTRPTILFADEPTGNLDSKTGGEILELMRTSTDAYGQTTVMVTHEARAAAIADRVLFLADGLIVRQLGTNAQPAEILEVMNSLELMIRVALRGMARRKLRTVLTAIAIVLGVALVTGTYVLTDSIKGAFDGIFTAGLPRHRRDRDRQVGVHPERAGNDDGAAVRRVAAAEDPRACRTSRTRSAASAAIAHLIVDGKVDRLRRRAEPRLQRRSDAAASSTRSRSSTGTGRGRTRS